MHQRRNGGLLAGVERRVLIAIAGRLPACITPDHLTTLAILAMAGAALSLLASPDGPAGVWAFAGCLALNWFGDSLDGTLARVRHIERPRYGYYVDHVIDLMGVALLLVGFAASRYMSAFVALSLLAAYAMISAETFLSTHVRGVFHLSFAGVGPTELRVLLAVGVMVERARPWVEVAGRRLRFFDVGGAIAAALLAAAFLIRAVRNGRALYVAEPAPR